MPQTSPLPSACNNTLVKLSLFNARDLAEQAPLLLAELQHQTAGHQPEYVIARGWTLVKGTRGAAIAGVTERKQLAQQTLVVLVSVSKPGPLQLSTAALWP